jgi:phosphatidylglycerol---prolipoprotein diacylglyceryl transferase
MIFFSFIGGAWIMGKQLERYGMDKELAWDMLAGIAIGGILGAKLYYLGLHWRDLVEHPARELTSRGGLVWYGGLIGGVVAYYIQVKNRGIRLATAYDACGPALALAYAIGRMGCFLVGDDYGVYTSHPIGIAFPIGSPPSTAGYLRSVGDTGVPANLPDSAVVTVHPTQLYEVGLALIMFAILWRLGARKLKPGQLFAAWMGLYSIERFMIEFVRAKGDRFVLGMSTSQVASIILFVLAVVLWLKQRTAPDFVLPKASKAASKSS